MKKWILKAIVQKTISYLPFANRINFLFQKYVTKGVFLSDEYFYDRLGHAKSHLEAYASKNTGQKTPPTCLELGTGWYPVVPIAFFLAGSQKVFSVDISFLTSKKRMRTTLEKFMQAEKTGRLRQQIPVLDEKFEVLRQTLLDFDALELNEVFEKINLVYHIEDARKLSLASGSIDLVNSNNTFEHIYPEILKPILAEMKRVVRPQTGVMSHFIDMSDHFAHFDRSINIYNFLQFSDAQWHWVDNSIQPQSRLRIEEYRKIYVELGIEINAESFRPGNLEELKSVRLSKKYEGLAPEMLAVSHCHFVS